MCTLYSQVKGQAEIRAIIDAIIDSTGNLPPQPAIFPDKSAPVVRDTAKGRELLNMRWGFPPPKFAKIKRPVVNVRETKKKFWQEWLVPIEHRCLVPATSYCEHTKEPDPNTGYKIPTWFALNEKRPLFFFAGIWREWTGTRGTKSDPVEGDHLLYSFLTTDANNVVEPIHDKSMPVILTTQEEWKTWMTAPVEVALRLQRPLAENLLKIVATGEKKDAA